MKLESTNPPMPGNALRSPDGTQWWDGYSWQPVVKEAPSDAVKSPDGQYWWDGAQWVAFSSASAPQQVTAIPHATAPPKPHGYAAPATSQVTVEWSGGSLHADASRIVAMTGSGAVLATFEYANIQRAYVDAKSGSDTISIQSANEVRSFEACVPRDAVAQLVTLLGSAGVTVEHRSWAVPANASPASYRPAAAPLATMRDVATVSAEKVASVGTLIVAAGMIIVSAFLSWYTFQTQGGFPVQGQSGLTNGYGIWALVLGGYTVVNAIVVTVATSPRGMKVAVRALWTDFLLVCVALILGIVELSGGGWVVVGTTIPLAASPGPGLYLLGTGALALLIAVIRLTVVLRKRAWSWSAPSIFA
jgi:hypothetical protein